MDEAFYYFTKNSQFSDAELVSFRSAAENLAQALTHLSKKEALRCKDISNALNTIFPENKQFKWTLEDTFKKGKTDLVYRFLPP